jgi:peroxiredoxin
MRKAKLFSWMTFFLICSHLSLASAIGHHKQGDSVPNFAIRTIDGRQISLDQQEGKIIVLAFWKLKDDKSSKMLTDLSRISEEFQDKQVTLLAINGDKATDKQIGEMARARELRCSFASDPDLAAYSSLHLSRISTHEIFMPRPKPR